ncbi:MAG: hypothetical protein GY698_16100, partial [Actinomycetia bacterium]|nr:hypothetical protein [Actinomycetes bacterium]
MVRDIRFHLKLATLSCVVVGVGAVPQAQAQAFDPVIQLSSLDGNNGFRLDGVTAGDHSGHSVSTAGDVNGDDIDDLLIGAPYAGPNGQRSGSSYVVFGSSTFSSVIGLSTLNGTSGFRLDGVEAWDESGTSVSTAGDVNDDGFDDLLIGAPSAKQNEDGASYVVFGSSTFSSVIGLSTLNGTSGFRL